MSTKYLISALAILILFACNQKKLKTGETSCINQELKPVIYSDLKSLLKQHEPEVETHYPTQQENALKNGDEDAKDEYQRAYLIYDQYNKADENNCSNIIASKYHISRTCLDSVWSEGVKDEVKRLSGS